MDEWITFGIGFVLGLIVAGLCWYAALDIMGFTF